MFEPEKDRRVCTPARDERVPIANCHTFDFDTGKKTLEMQESGGRRQKASNEVATRWTNLIPWRIDATWPTFALRFANMFNMLT